METEKHRRGAMLLILQANAVLGARRAVDRSLEAEAQA
jgi:hypothetical protein